MFIDRINTGDAENIGVFHPTVSCKEKVTVILVAVEQKRIAVRRESFTAQQGQVFVFDAETFRQQVIREWLKVRQ